MTFPIVVYSSGGLKGISMLGILKYWNDKEFHSFDSEIRGTSIGALIALCHVLKLPNSFISEFEYFWNTRQLQPSFFRLSTTFSLLSNNSLNTIIDFIIRSQSLDPNTLTFQQLFDFRPVLLSIYVTHLQSGICMAINKNTKPNGLVKSYILASMAIPLLFPPQQLEENDIYVDGAMSKGGFPVPDIPGVLGICVFRKVDNTERHEPLTFLTFLLLIIRFITGQKRLTFKNAKIITIPFDIEPRQHTLNFNALIDLGYTACESFFK